MLHIAAKVRPHSSELGSAAYTNVSDRSAARISQIVAEMLQNELYNVSVCEVALLCCSEHVIFVWYLGVSTTHETQIICKSSS